MAKLELPIQAFIDDFLRREFPNLDWSPGSALRDLLLQPMATLLQPLRHEIDQTKIGQSLLNYPYMSRQALDRLALNWGYVRRRGGVSVGTLRLFFRSALDYNFNYLEFEANDGTRFVLQTPVSISGRGLLANRTGNGEYFFDVAVQSVGIGSRYGLPAGSISVIRNGPPELNRVEQLVDFDVTAPDETNLDVVEALYKGLGSQNLLSPASIRTPLLQAFPGILDVFVAGPAHPDMVRDLVTVQIGNIDTQIHRGGMVDVWLNTNTLVRREVVFSFLPTSRQVRLVTAEQAAQNEILYSFGSMFLSVEGQYADPAGQDTVNVDESSRVDVSSAGLIISADVVSDRVNGRYHLSEESLLTGSTLVSVCPEQASLVLDPLVAAAATSSASLNDALRIGSTFYPVVSSQHGVFELGLAPQNLLPVVTATAVTKGGRTLTSVAASDAAPGDRLVIPAGPAAGHYKVLAVSGVTHHVGIPLSSGSVTFESSVTTGSLYAVTAASVPAGLIAGDWVTFANPGGFDQSATWSQITEVQRTATLLKIVVTGGPLGTSDVLFVRGLLGDVSPQTSAYLERPKQPAFTPGSAAGHTVAVGHTSSVLVAGTNQLTQPGFAQDAQVGDLIVFDNVVLTTQADVIESGGDGTRFTTFVSRVINCDTVQFTPPLPADVGEETTFTLLRNRTAVASLTVASVSGNTFKVATWPLGIGDAIGMGIKGTRTRPGGTLQSKIVGGSVTGYKGLGDLTHIQPGDSLTVTGAVTGGAGPFTVSHVIQDTIFVTGTHGVSESFAGSFTVTGPDVFPVKLTSAGDVRVLAFQAPYSERTISLSATDYANPTSFDVGSTVRQRVGSTTYLGSLESFNNVTRTWTIRPNDPAFDVFVVSASLGEELIVDGSLARGFITSTGTLATAGYVEPAPSDIGQIVRQGNFLGVLESYTGAPGYTWTVRPLGSADAFSSTTERTYVDRNGDSTWASGEPYGTLTAPASEPQINLGAVTLSLPDNVPFAVGSTVSVLSRLGRTGGMFDNGQFKIYAPTNAQDFPALGAVVGSTRLLCFAGESFGDYQLSDVDSYAMSVAGGRSSSFVRITNAPTARIYALPTQLTAGATSFSVPDSRIGAWGHAGRILRLTYLGRTYQLTISGPVDLNTVNLADALPVTMYPGNAITYEIVEGFNTPFWIVETATLQSYRAVRGPRVYDQVLASASGYQPGTGTEVRYLGDQAADFSALVPFMDFAHGDLAVILDSGPEAGLQPIQVTDYVDANTIELERELSPAGPVAYRLVRVNPAPARDRWLRAIVMSATTVMLDVPAGEDLSLWGSLEAFRFSAVPGFGAGALTWSGELTPFRASSYNAASRILTLDTRAIATVPGSLAGIYTNGTGFAPDTVGKAVRLYQEAVDRIQARSQIGSVTNSYAYYAAGYMEMPIAKIESVVRLNETTLQAAETLAYNLEVGDAGLRYTATEDLTLRITDERPELLFQPFRITYLTDPTVSRAQEYLDDPSRRVVTTNYAAKRQATLSVRVQIDVVTQRSEADVRNAIALYISTLPSDTAVTKDRLIKAVYDAGVADTIDTETLVLEGTLYNYDGQIIEFANGASIYGNDVSCYVPDTIIVRIQEV
jgi:hypothetical protein